MRVHLKALRYEAFKEKHNVGFVLRCGLQKDAYLDTRFVLFVEVKGRDLRATEIFLFRL